MTRGGIYWVYTDRGFPFISDIEPSAGVVLATNDLSEAINKYNELLSVPPRLVVGVGHAGGAIPMVFGAIIRNTLTLGLPVFTRISAGLYQADFTFNGGTVITAAKISCSVQVVGALHLLLPTAIPTPSAWVYSDKVLRVQVYDSSFAAADVAFNAILTVQRYQFP